MARDREILDVQRSLRAGSRALLWALALAALGSCTNLPVATEDAKTPDVFDRIRALDILPRSPQPVDQRPEQRPAREADDLHRRRLPPSDATGAVASMSSGRRHRRRSRRRRGLRAQLREHADQPGRQGGARRHHGRRLFDRSARAGIDQPVVRQAGAENRPAVRARKRAAHEQRRADPRHRRLSHHPDGRRGGRRQHRHRRRPSRTRLRRLRASAALRIRRRARQAARQLRDAARHGARRSRRATSC